MSTTVAPENYEYLAALVRSGKARSLAEAVDEAVERLRRGENRIRLATATTSYYESLSSEALKEEKTIGVSMRNASQDVDFDREL